MADTEPQMSEKETRSFRWSAEVVARLLLRWAVRRTLALYIAAASTAALVVQLWLLHGQLEVQRSQGRVQMSSTIATLLESNRNEQIKAMQLGALGPESWSVLSVVGLSVCSEGRAARFALASQAEELDDETLAMLALGSLDSLVVGLEAFRGREDVRSECAPDDEVRVLRALSSAVKHRADEFEGVARGLAGAVSDYFIRYIELDAELGADQEADLYNFGISVYYSLQDMCGRDNLGFGAVLSDGRRLWARGEDVADLVLGRCGHALHSLSANGPELDSEFIEWNIFGSASPTGE